MYLFHMLPVGCSTGAFETVSLRDMRPWLIPSRISVDGNMRCKSSRSQMFFKIGVLKIFVKFTGKHLCWRLFLVKLQFRRSATSLRRYFNTYVFL